MTEIPPSNSLTNYPNQLQFVVVNDPELDYELIQEVWFEEQLLADLRYVEGEWVVTFFVQNKAHRLSLKNFAEIQHNFQQFVQAQSRQDVRVVS